MCLPCPASRCILIARHECPLANASGTNTCRKWRQSGAGFGMITNLPGSCELSLATDAVFVKPIDLTPHDPGEVCRRFHELSVKIASLYRVCRAFRAIHKDQLYLAVIGSCRPGCRHPRSVAAQFLPAILTISAEIFSISSSVRVALVGVRVMVTATDFLPSPIFAPS